MGDQLESVPKPVLRRQDRTLQPTAVAALWPALSRYGHISNQDNRSRFDQ